MFAKFKEEVLKDPRSSKLNFEPDGRNHYVYRVSKDREHYYGSRTDIGEDTIGDKNTFGGGYYTSSEYLKYDFKKNRINYKVKIIKRFDNEADKIIYESYLHQKFDVRQHPGFINRCNQTPFGFSRGVGKNHSGAFEVWQVAIKRDLDTEKEVGDIVGKFESITEASKITKYDENQIRWCADTTKQTRTVNGSTFVYPKNYNKNKIITLKKEGWFDFQVPVYCVIIGQNGEPKKEIENIYKKFNSMTEAAEIMGVQAAGISLASNSNPDKKMVSGYAFILPRDYNKLKVRLLVAQNYYGVSEKRKVGKYDRKTQKLLEIFESSNEAANSVKGNKESIKNCCRGTSKTSSGFIWKYIPILTLDEI